MSNGIVNLQVRKSAIYPLVYIIIIILFLPLIFETWCKEIISTPMYDLCNKLKNVKGVLKELNLKYFGKISERMLEAKRKWMRLNVGCKQIDTVQPCDMTLARSDSDFGVNVSTV